MKIYNVKRKNWKDVPAYILKRRFAGKWDIIPTDKWDIMNKNIIYQDEFSP